MNSNISNETLPNSHAECVLVLFSTDPYVLSLNVIRTVISFFYAFWVILVFKIKEFRVKQMAFLHNLNLIGILYCISGISYMFYTNCTELSVLTCYIQGFNSIFMSILSGYGLAALAFYRLCCDCIPNLSKVLNYFWLTISIGSVWFLSIAFSAIQIFAFGKPLSYYKELNMCVADSSTDIIPFLFFFATVMGLPNCIILITYVISLRIAKRRKKQLRTQRKSNSLRITVQLVLYIIMYELSCICILITFYQLIMMQSIVPENLLQFLRCLRWFHHISPLALLYLHPVMLKKYRSILGKN